jgi:hypothetical protein
VIPDPLSRGLYLALTEAMTNCHHHAYISVRQDGLGIQDTNRDWWMFSQERDGMLTVVFCDLGVGIPSTIPVRKPDLLTRLKTLFGRYPTDAQVIEEAVRDSVSRTGKAYRGKGLNQLVDVIRKTHGASLLLLSNRGLYVARPGHVETRDYSGSILGTVILWAVPLL